MPQSGATSTPTEDRTGQRSAPATTAGQAVGALTVTRVTAELAHRTRAADIFPTEWVRLSELDFRVTAHWPADHSFFGPVDDLRQDPMIVAETLRQTTMALAHAEFGAPLDTHFVMWDLGISTVPSELLLADAAEPVTVDVVCSEVRRRGRGLSSMRTTMEFHRAGRLVARGTGSMGCTSPAAYRRLRAGQPGSPGSPGTAIPPLPPVPHELVGRHRAEDVVLARSDRPGTWLLRVDTSHPVLFARPNDHVPGMVLFEAARQAATAATGGRVFLPSDLASSFSRYTELDSPCLLETEVFDKGGADDEARSPDRGDDGDEGEVTVRVFGLQNDEPVFTVTLASALHRRSPWPPPRLPPAPAPSPVRSLT
ncbi:ScbA/BarX family gamma-butyrolactone biosynthesis protein [Streptomyces sp. P9-A2]|uniref:ScbA/BarX family gamma-butyrolactone biosynthesis protein n=1 Tax=Streptomyces sp. P9-A2 TaxID=3072284 RepID=UPI002FC8206D